MKRAPLGDPHESPQERETFALVDDEAARKPDPVEAPEPEPQDEAPGEQGEVAQVDEGQPDELEEAGQEEAPTANGGPHLTAPAGSLKRFHRALRKRQRDPVVAVQYGDSHSTDGSMIRAMRDHFSQGAPPSPSYVTPSQSARWNARVRKEGKWKRQNWLRRADEGSFGPAGLAWVSDDPGASLTLELEDGPSPPGTEVTLLYARQKNHLPLEISAGNKVLKRIKSARKPRRGVELGRVTVALPSGTEEVTVEIACRRCARGASVRVFGWVVHLPGAVVEWDNFGVIGTATRSLYRRTDQTLTSYLKWRDPDLLVVWYGANAVPADGDNLDMGRYQERYKEVVQNLKKSAPKASCLIIGPPDMAYYPEKTCFMNRRERRVAKKRKLSGADRRYLRKNRTARACDPDSLIKRRGRKIVEYPGPKVNTPRQWTAYVKRCSPYSPRMLPTMIKAQKEVAQELGCAYFDSFAAMGGAGTLPKWTCEEPPRASADLVHMTRPGYETVADLLLRELDPQY